MTGTGATVGVGASMTGTGATVGSSASTSTPASGATAAVGSTATGMGSAGGSGAGSGAAATTTLSTRSGLQDLKLGRTLSGGFLTVGYFTRAVTSGVSKYLSKAKGSDAEGQQLLAMLGTLPHKGETPILLTSTAVPEGAGTRGELTLAIPKDAVEDVSSLVMNVTRMAKAKKP